MRAMLLAAVLAGWTASARGDGEHAVVVTPILHAETTAAGQPIALPAGPVAVTVSRFEIAPGARLPVHRHPYPRYAYVLAGTLSVTDAQSGAATLYHAGDYIIEMVGRWHYGTNVGTDPVVLIVTDQAPPGESNTEVRH